jgi:integrase/recombinase XerD
VGGIAVSGQPSNAELIQAYLGDWPVDRAIHTRNRHQHRVQRFAKFIKGVHLLDATTGDIDAWLDSLAASDDTRRFYGASLDNFYEWATGHRHMAQNPARHLRVWRRARRWSAPTMGRLPDPSPELTLQETVDAYVWDRYARGEVTARTQRAFADRLQTLLSSFGPERPMIELDRRTIADWQRSIGSWAPASRRSTFSTVRVFCQWATLEKYLPADPTIGFARIREPRRVPRALSAESIGRLLAECGDDLRDRAMVQLQVGLGLRCIEVANLEVADYDPAALSLLVRGKGGHERLLPIPSTVAKALDAYLDQYGRMHGPLIRTRSGRRRGGVEGHLGSHVVSERVGELMARAGLKRSPYDGVSAHALRHSCASDVLDRCGNVRVVQGILGHQSLATTEIYLRRASLDQMRAALEGRDYEDSKEAIQ